MALIRWQKTAKTHVRQIFDYYKEHASLPVATALSGLIVRSVDVLEDFPTAGVIDTDLSTKGAIYRYVVVRYSRRTYRVYYLYENDICAILAIWDCSMQPIKRKSIIKH